MADDDGSQTEVLMEADPQTVGEATFPELRIVLIGKTRAGKSTLGGIITGNTEAFTSQDAAGGGTEKCHVGRSTTEGPHVAVVDTPGLFNIGTREEELLREIQRSVDLASPGPHMFLLVLRAGVITRDELDLLQVFESTFGRRAMAYTTVVLTHKDQEVDDAVVESAMKENKSLREFIERCQWRYFTLNIDDTSPTRVTELLKKVSRRTEFYYSHEMLQVAEEAVRRERQEDQPKAEGKLSRRAFLERSGLVGIIVGSVAGYLLGGGELTSTSGALLGAVADSVLSVGTTALGLKAKVLSDQCCKQGF